MTDTKTPENANTAGPIFYNESRTNLQNVVLDIVSKAKTADLAHTAAMLLNDGRPYSIMTAAEYKKLADIAKDTTHNEHLQAIEILNDQTCIVAEKYLKQKYKRATSLVEKYKLNSKSANDSMVNKLAAIASTHYDGLSTDQKPRMAETKKDGSGTEGTKDQGDIIPFVDTTWSLRLEYVNKAVSNAAIFIKHELLKRLHETDRQSVQHLDGWGVFQELHEWRQSSQLGVLTASINDTLSNNTGSSTTDCRQLQTKLAHLIRDLPSLADMTALQIIELLGVDNILKHTLARDPHSASVVYSFYELPIDNIDIAEVIAKLKKVQKTTAWVGTSPQHALFTNTGTTNTGGGAANNTTDNTRQQNQQSRDTNARKVDGTTVARVSEVYKATLRKIANRDKGNLPSMAAAHKEACYAPGSISSVMRPMDANRYFKSHIFQRQWSHDLQNLPWKEARNKHKHNNANNTDANAMATSVQGLEQKFETMSKVNASLIATNEHLVAALQTAGLIEKK